MAGEKIHGIHNYCDRWCERCQLASRCNLFEAEREERHEKEESVNQAFWERLTVNFSKAQQLLYQTAERHGIDLNEIAKEVADVKAEENRIREQSTEHPLSKLSAEYAQITHEWLRSQPGMLEKLEELKEQIVRGEFIEVAKNSLDVIQDCLAVIQWYESFISVKVTRALMGKIDFSTMDAEFRKDSDGSAKIAILAMDRSRQAWEKLFSILPEKEDDFLTVLGMLEKMRSLAMMEFPRALDFVRPGFDEL